MDRGRRRRCPGVDGVSSERDRTLTIVMFWIRRACMYIMAPSGESENNTISMDSLVINAKKLSNVLHIEKIINYCFFLVNKNFIEKVCEKEFFD